MSKIGEKLSELEGNLTGIENALLKRKVDRQDEIIDSALDIVDQAVEMGILDLDSCEGCDDDVDNADVGNEAVVEGPEAGEMPSDDEVDAYINGVASGEEPGELGPEPGDDQVVED